jgi:hypothetical protein
VGLGRSSDVKSCDGYCAQYTTRQSLRAGKLLFGTEAGTRARVQGRKLKSKQRRRKNGQVYV